MSLRATILENIEFVLKAALLGALSWLVLSAPSSAQSSGWLEDAKTHCSVSDPDPLEGESVTWTGGCIEGRLEGTGTLTRLMGDQVLNARTGGYSGGKPVGEGVLTRGDGVVVRGSWLGGEIEGPVKIFYPDGSPLFEGSWHHGEAEGFGTYHYADGSTYAGQWHAGKRDGTGVFTLSTGAQYDGEWVQDEGQGHVRERMPDGSVYTGSWKDGQRHGHGVLKDGMSGRIYEGEFCFDLVCPVSSLPKDKFGIPVQP